MSIYFTNIKIKFINLVNIKLDNLRFISDITIFRVDYEYSIERKSNLETRLFILFFKDRSKISPWRRSSK